MKKSLFTLSWKQRLLQLISTIWSRAYSLLPKSSMQNILLVLLFIMFPLGYFESLRWPFFVPKATHGILKGLFLLVLGTIYIFRSKFTTNIYKNSEFIVIGLFLLSMITSSLFSLVPETSLLFLWYPFIGALYIYVFRTNQTKSWYVDVFIGISFLLITITFMFAVFSIFSRYEVDNVYYFIFLDHRANYFLNEIRKTGKYVCLGPYFMLVPLAVTYLINVRSSYTRKILSLLAIFMSILTAVISNNRIDVLVIAIQLCVIIWFLPRRIAVIILIAVIPITQLGLAITQQYFGFNLEERILRPHYERDLETIVMRETYWSTALNNFRQFPIFGTGPNTYNDVSDFPLRRYYDHGAKEDTVRPDVGIGVHNLFIERLADTGLFGLITFVGVLLIYAKQDMLTFIKKEREDRARYALFALSSWSWILYGITDNAYGAQGFVTFFFIRGVMNHI